ncbi:hypothetical protein EVAR_25766_1 [Eumeta japonica]|uniref:Uncharacterized protein n=1 Tax=Eumeta variegata TaxID=151549 RepID=A0A4C2A2Q4_EUMVA|nr:hypothetical protein EVAR_25766_1 [Eumeta japonica]
MTAHYPRLRDLNLKPLPSSTLAQCGSDVANGRCIQRDDNVCSWRFTVLFDALLSITSSGGARRRRRRRPPTASRLKGPRKQKSFAYKLLKRGLANLMSPTSTSGVAPPLITSNYFFPSFRQHSDSKSEKPLIF